MEEPEQAPLVFYIDLAEGQAASLESVARLSLAWSELVIELCAIIDPSSEVEIIVVDVVDGCLKIRTIVKAIGRVANQRPILAACIGGILSTFFHKPVDDLSGLFWPMVYEAMGLTHVSHTDENTGIDRAVVEKATIVAQKTNVASAQKQRLYAQAEADSSVIGVGATTSFTERPPVFVPRSEFARRAGIVKVEIETTRVRTITRRENVILLTPQLRAKKLVWKFADADGNLFSAKMADLNFINALQAGSTGTDLRIGIVMDVDIEMKQEMFDGVWLTQSFEVVRVRSPAAPIPAPDDRNLLFYEPRKPND
ncbi:hypothetical protein [Polymorphobacter megasporae]|uniref:hypothetical protein n=1 Tax=Glacieibacterium megasporae TaxID=2835787 RepID=UPI001C1E620B|nr:hypothetical protein [Polymorphobacter megasporae]UAJ11840.1 hypothetical protein KTC28_09375 [Polymorphobacter megasporae]